jgi:hypothetical protein
MMRPARLRLSRRRSGTSRIWSEAKVVIAGQYHYQTLIDNFPLRCCSIILLC